MSKKYARIVFHHIPKSGGSHAAVVLNSYVKPKGENLGSARRPIHKDGSGRQWIDERLERNDVPFAKLFSSHNAFFPDEFKPRPEELYMTWIRNPADMLYSGYHFWNMEGREPHQFQPQWVRELAMKCVGHESEEAYVDFALKNKKVFPMGFFDWTPDQFDFVGISELMDQSLACIASMFGLEFWDKPKGKINSNGSNRSPYTYRRAEVEALLSREMDVYNSCVDEWGPKIRQHEPI